MKGRMEKIVHPKYEGEERVRKLNSMLKLSGDTIFYLMATFSSYLLFRNEYWFPTIAGGSGASDQFYRNYPNWPDGSRLSLEIYFMIQLGIHFFSVF